MNAIILAFLLCSLYSSVSAFVSIANKHFVYNNVTLFFSGVNAPWNSYGYDFGSGAYNSSRKQFELWFDRVSAHGGNVVRLWLFVDGHWTPKFDGEGYATGNDTQSLIDELGQYLDYAAKKNVFVIICLWNGAVAPTKTVIDLFSDDNKLDRYFEKSLKPLVSGLKDKKALMTWEVINEAGGSITQNIKDSNPCFDTAKLVNSGANWAKTNLTMKNALKFINRHVDAIKSADPKALVTTGAWSERPNLDTEVCDYCFNYYSDECLRSAGGKAKGVIDYYQIHTYPFEGKFNTWSPMLKSAADLKLDKPVMIGEVPAKCSPVSDSAAKCYELAYNNGYAGILGWRYDYDGDKVEGHESYSEEGMMAIKNMTKNGSIQVKIM